ncbi:EAL domain-containing protein [Fluviibacterium sp. S390]|uniref:EAL domain-containing protein n=1 Tax=Fluviibacterium sp. S390 TaxID=3415139 RepID=UPI003C7CA3DC
MPVPGQTLPSGIHFLASVVRGQWGLAASAPLLALFWYLKSGDVAWGMALSGPVVLALAWLPLWRAGHRLAQLPLASPRQRLIRALCADRDAAQGQTVCILLNLDDTPRLLERYSPATLDRTMDALADRAQQTLRDQDHCAALAPGLIAIAMAPAARYDLETALQIGARLQARLSDPIPVGEDPQRLSFSVGIALSAQVASGSGDAVLAAAETALKRAQYAGAGSIRVHDPARPVPQVPDTARITRALDALESGQIRPWFQPQVSNDTGDISGVEALARWVHPDRGLLGPAEFFPEIEAAGRFERLGEVMRRHAYLALKTWDTDGLDIPGIGVNVTLAELRNPAFADKIAWELDGFDILPHRLTLEILESVVSGTSGDVVARNIQMLASYGCGLDLDDFGTGHASITSLRRFPVGRIKIDRSFVTGVDHDRNQQQMISAIVTMAERLDLDALAEGVETPGEHAMLAQLGCTHVQGYGIARPMPQDDLPAWVHELRHRLPKPAPLHRKLG